MNIPDEDPTKSLWEDITRKYPGKGTRRPRTREERLEAAQRSKKYFDVYAHPRCSEKRNGKLSEVREVLGYCIICNMPLTTQLDADRGIGKDCLTQGINDGSIVVQDTKIILKNKKKKK